MNKEEEISIKKRKDGPHHANGENARGSRWLSNDNISETHREKLDGQHIKRGSMGGGFDAQYALRLIWEI